MGKKRILFMIPHLGGGGAEKVLVTLINSLDSKKYDISILVSGLNHTRCKEIKNPVYYYSVGQQNNLYFGKKSMKWQHDMPPRFKADFVKTAFNLYEHDVDFLFMDCLLLKIFAQGNSNNISIFRVTSDYLARPLSTWTLTDNNAYINMHMDCYKAADYIVAGSEHAAVSFAEVTGVSENMLVINNIFDVSHIKASSEAELDVAKKCFVIGTVGNFRLIKGHMRLIEVCNRLNKEGFVFELWLVGKGSEEDNLRKKVAEYGMENVVFWGYQDNPYKIMRNMDLYVNPAFSEGFPNAPAEAVVLGIPCVVADHCGEREIFGDSEYGLVVDNSEQGLYEGIKRMLTDAGAYEYYKNATLKRQEFFNPTRVLERYEKLFGE